MNLVDGDFAIDGKGPQRRLGHGRRARQVKLVLSSGFADALHGQFMYEPSRATPSVGGIKLRHREGCLVVNAVSETGELGQLRLSAQVSRATAPIKEEELSRSCPRVGREGSSDGEHRGQARPSGDAYDVAPDFRTPIGVPVRRVEADFVSDGQVIKQKRRPCTVGHAADLKLPLTGLVREIRHRVGSRALDPGQAEQGILTREEFGRGRRIEMELP